MQEKTLKELIDLAKSQLGQADAMIDWNERNSKNDLLVTALGVNMALSNARKLVNEAYVKAGIQYGIIDLDKPVGDEKS
jgi:hypothetical protein